MLNANHEVETVMGDPPPHYPLELPLPNALKGRRKR